jgi:pheromone shutdown protein TraB
MLLTRAQVLRSLNNFHSLMAIVSALHNNSISRLRKTFVKVPRSALRSMEELQELMSANENHKVYRALLASVPPPCIPFMYVSLASRERGGDVASAHFGSEG